jgi:hypothetical protein
VTKLLVTLHWQYVGLTIYSQLYFSYSALISADGYYERQNKQFAFVSLIALVLSLTGNQYRYIANASTLAAK